MHREGLAVGGEHDGESIVCESFGYTPSTEWVWWIPETKEKFIYQDGEYYPYDGPVIHGTGYTF